MNPNYIAIASVAFCFGVVCAFAIELFGLRRLLLRHDNAVTGNLEAHLKLWQSTNDRLGAVDLEGLRRKVDAIAAQEIADWQACRARIREGTDAASKDAEALMRAIDIIDRRTQAMRRDESFFLERLASIWNAVNGIAPTTPDEAPRGMWNDYFTHCVKCGAKLEPGESAQVAVTDLFGGRVYRPVCDKCFKAGEVIDANQS